MILLEKTPRAERGLRVRGIDILSYTGGVTSSTHMDREINESIAAFDDAVKDLVKRNVLPRM